MDPFEILRKANEEAVAAESDSRTRSRLGCIKWVALLVIAAAIIYIKLHGG